MTNSVNLSEKIMRLEPRSDAGMVRMWEETFKGYYAYFHSQVRANRDQPETITTDPQAPKRYNNA